MNKAITVKQLRKIFDKLDDAGKGDYQVFLTDDEEMNGYHACWYLPEAADEMEDAANREYIEEINCDLCVLGDDKDKAVYLG